MKHTHYIRQSYLFCKYRNYVLGIQKYMIGRNVLEVGPNKGVLFAQHYPKTRKYTLLEPNKHFEAGYVRLQRKHPNLHYKIGGFEDYVADETFDTIVMMAVISHIRMDPQAIAAKIYSLLNRGGFLIVETNNTRRNLAVFDILDRDYERIETKASYSGLMKWLKIDYRTVTIYKKP